MEESDVTAEGAEQLFKNESKFYHDAELYWSQVEPTVNGMLGGFGDLSDIDIRFSKLFLNQLFNSREKPGRERALDCGAGIGRITKQLLCKYFNKVDLVEQNAKFVEASKTFLSFEKNIGTFYNTGLQNFVPVKNFYDVIWCQWVLGHLTDEHLVNFLKECSQGLKKNGLVIIKENISASEIVVDEEDSSVTRTEDLYIKLFKKANLKLIRHCKQKHFPKQLFSVKIFALKPNKNSVASICAENVPVCRDVNSTDISNNCKSDSIHLEKKMNIFSINDGV